MTAATAHCPDAPSFKREPADRAIPRLLETNGPRLYSLALRLCGNAADAEDMVQDVFLQAHRKWHTFRGDSDPGTWLYSIAARSCKARMRRKGGVDRRVPAISQLMPWRETRIASNVDSESGPLSESMRRESVDVVRAAIMRLPEHFRLPLLFREVLELPIEQVAEALNIKPETIKTRLHRARLLLRKALLAKLPSRPAPAPLYDKQVCMDLLRAKLEAMDRGRGFPIDQAIVCDRCRAVFAELDLAQTACAGLAEGHIPDSVRTRILAAMKEDSSRVTGHKPREPIGE